MDAETRTKSRASWLTVPEFFSLDAACRALVDSFGEMSYGVYLVGSCLQRPDYRDVDLSLMMPDDKFDAMFPNKYAVLFMNAAVSEWLSKRTGLKIDFKFQDMTKANEEHKGPRNAMGIRADHYKQEPPR